MESIKKKDDISGYIKDQEYVANTYVMRCFAVTLLIYSLVYLMNILGIFVVDQNVMQSGYFPFLAIFIVVYLISKKLPLSSAKTKYILLSCIILEFTIIGVTLTYHVVLASILPFLYATLYPSKNVMKYVYVLSVISTVIVVYGGYYFGLCDANMLLLTAGRMKEYVINGQFVLTEINNNPALTLALFFIFPRCILYIAFSVVSSSIVKIVSGSIEKAKLTEELERAKEEAESANRAKPRFLAKVSHEIRTPINAVMGMNEMILRESKEDNVKQYAVDVKNSSIVLLNLINELLDSSKIESGKMEIVPVNYEMGSVLNDLYNMISIKAHEKGLGLVFDVDEEMPAGYFGDDKRIRQVLSNLLTNAVKYTERGKVTLSVRCRREEENAVIRFAVKDTGIGIKQEDIGKLYDEFQRFDMSRNRNVEGTGLGMVIVQQFLKLMDSELHVESEYEKGSEFSFEIVQKITKDKPLGDFRERILAANDIIDTVSDFVAPDAKVLVVDDYKINLKVFSGLLKRTKMKITGAESGKECLEQVKEQDFDIIFLDHMMPEMDGIETLHEMRKRGYCQNVPIIMLTANAIVGDKERYLNEGFDDFLTKPIVPEKLNRMIMKHIPDKIRRVNQPIGEKVEKKQDMTAFSVDQVTELEKLRKKLPEINYRAGIMNCGGDEDFYLEIFHDFVRLPIKEELNGFLKKQDYKNYCIKVHGFKNNAYTIGASALGDLAYEMECVTKEDAPEDIQEMQICLFEQYDRIRQQYCEAATD